jgi:circadian clock protein KaiC
MVPDGGCHGGRERPVRVILSETANELRTGAASHGWELGDKIEVFEVVPPESLLEAGQQQSLLYASDLELGETTKLIFEAVERTRAKRSVLDSLSEIRLLGQSSRRYCRQILALKHYFARRNAPVLLLDDLTADTNDKTVHSVANGAVRLEEIALDHGRERRRLRVIKYRAQAFRGGYHDFTIKTGGAQVLPRLIAAENRQRSSAAASLRVSPASIHGWAAASSRARARCCSDPRARARACSSCRRRFGRAAVHLRRGDRAAVRPPGPLGFDLAAMRASGKLIISQQAAAELSPGEFAHRVRRRIQQSRPL